MGWLLCCICATAILYALAAPPAGVWPLAFVALAPMLVALRGRGPGARAVIGAATGTLTSLLTIAHPLGEALSRFFEVPPWYGTSGAILVGTLFGGGGFAVFGALAGDLAARPGAAAMLRASAAWVAADLYRTLAFTGLPWLLLGELLAPAPRLAQLAALGGVHLLSFWVASVNTCFVLLILAGFRRQALAAGGALAVLGLAAMAFAPSDRAGVPGVVRAAEVGTHVPSGAIRVALVQPALPDAWRGDVARVQASLDRLIDLSRRAGPVDLLVWPENAVAVLLPANHERVVQALSQLEPRPRHTLLGAPRFDAEAPDRVYNSAILLDEEGALLAVHDKVHLVPFTEYLPAPVAAFASSDPAISAGTRPTPLAFEGATLGPLVCYEMLFPDLALSLVRAGADVLVNVSHDGYFGGSAGARQHLTSAVLRAIELRRPLLRATSDGITVAIDHGGRIVARLPEHVPGVLVVDLWPRTRLSPAARLGPSVAWLCVLGAGLATFSEVAGRARSRARRPPGRGRRGER